MKSLVLFTAAIIVAVSGKNIKYIPNHFSDSDEFINYINNEINTTWKAGKNFEGSPDDLRTRLKRMCGVLPGATSHLKLPLKENYMEVRVADLPENFDSREKWPGCPTIKEIRNQGPCGSCWAIAAVEAMSDRICIHSNGKKKTRLSVEDLLECCDTCGYGCYGGNNYKAWEYWVENGIVDGGSYGSHKGCKSYKIPPCDNKTEPCSYKGGTPLCVRKCDVPWFKWYRFRKHFGKSMTLVNDNETDIMTEIYNNGPVEAAVVDVYADLLYYKSGVYKHESGSPKAPFGHAVKIIGWGVENGTKYWLVANSLGVKWGEKGFFKILRGENECGIETYGYILAGLPKLKNKFISIKITRLPIL